MPAETGSKRQVGGARGLILWQPRRSVILSAAKNLASSPRFFAALRMIRKSPNANRVTASFEGPAFFSASSSVPWVYSPTKDDGAVRVSGRKDCQHRHLLAAQQFQHFRDFRRRVRPVGMHGEDAICLYGFSDWPRVQHGRFQGLAGQTPVGGEIDQYRGTRGKSSPPELCG